MKEMVLAIQSTNRGNTTERGLSPRSMEELIPVISVTGGQTYELCYIIEFYHVPRAGIRRDVFTRLSKVGVASGTGLAMTFAAMSVMCSLYMLNPVASQS